MKTKITLTNHPFAQGCFMAKAGKRSIHMILSHVDIALGVKPGIRAVCQAFNDCSGPKDRILIFENCTLNDKTV